MFVIYVCMYFKGFNSNDYDPWRWGRCVRKTRNQDDFIIEQNMATCKWCKQLCDNDSISQRIFFKMSKEVFNLPLVFVIVFFSKVVKYILLYLLYLWTFYCKERAWWTQKRDKELMIQNSKAKK